MVKIKWLDRVAELQDDGTWKSNNKLFESALNELATPDKVQEYSPSMEEALINLAKAHYPGLEVLEGPEPLEYEDTNTDIAY